MQNSWFSFPFILCILPPDLVQWNHILFWTFMLKYHGLSKVVTLGPNMPGQSHCLPVVINNYSHSQKMYWLEWHSILWPIEPCGQINIGRDFLVIHLILNFFKPKGTIWKN